MQIPKPLSNGVCVLKNKRSSRRRQARPIDLSAASLATGAPEIGAPALGQHHGLHAASLEISSPETKPVAKRVHSFEVGDSTIKRKRRGARPKLTVAQKAHLQSKLEKWWTQNPTQYQKAAISYVMKNLDGIEVGHIVVERQIVRPVYKKLKTKKRPK